MTTQAERLQKAIDRLVSNGPAIVEALRQAGYHNLALQTRHDFESLAHLGATAAGGRLVGVPKAEGRRTTRGRLRAAVTRRDGLQPVHLRGWATDLENHQRYSGVSVVVRYSEGDLVAWLRGVADALEIVDDIGDPMEADHD